MAQKAGANLVNMDQIQIHPTVFEDGSLVAEGVRGGGAILINNADDRFTNEMGTRDVVSAAEDPFGRAIGYVEKLETAPFYAIAVYPGIHHTMGGVRINTQNQAVSILGDVVPGLYAAGEVTGLHGSNRIGGNAICDVTVMGRNAGENATAQIAA